MDRRSSREQLAERARWLRAISVPGREEVLFELETLLRSIELTLLRRHADRDGRAQLGHDFSEEMRGLRDALHRSGTLARKLLPATAEQDFRFRTYLERHVADDARKPRMSQQVADQRSPDEGLFVLRRQLLAMHGMADQLVRQSPVSYRVFDDYAVMVEYVLASSRFFRPPGALEFRTEYDRVGSVRLLDLVQKLSDIRTRKALALGFLACFRLLRYLRFVPPAPAPLARRTGLILLLARDESANIAAYLTTDLRRLTANAAEAKTIAQAADEAAKHLREAVEKVPDDLLSPSAERDTIEAAREALSEGAKAAASALTQAAAPESPVSEVFDGQRARRERTAERLRRDLWICSQLLRESLEALFPAMRGESTSAVGRVVALQRFVRDFRQVGYYLLRPGDHDPFDKFFNSVDAMLHSPASPARDRHLYLECRRFLTVVDKGFALVNRRGELLERPFEAEQVQPELARYRATEGVLDPANDAAIADEVFAGSLDEITGAIESDDVSAPQESAGAMLGEPHQEPALHAPEEPEATPPPPDAEVPPPRGPITLPFRRADD